jgi:hypothetical protein
MFLSVKLGQNVPPRLSRDLYIQQNGYRTSNPGDGQKRITVGKTGNPIAFAGKKMRVGLTNRRVVIDYECLALIAVNRHATALCFDRVG